MKSNITRKLKFQKKKNKKKKRNTFFHVANKLLSWGIYIFPFEKSAS